jgi:hypothetical protein
MPAPVVFRGTREELRRLLRDLPLVLAGRAPDPLGIARGLQLRLGTTLLSKVQQDFITKSRGGVGTDGVKWAPLSPKTIARRRKGPKGKGKKKKAAPAPVDILRNTGELLRSLSPGVDEKPSGAPGQVFDVSRPGVIVVGTNKKPYHHKGIPGRLPARPLWPVDGKIPGAWLPAIHLAAARGVLRAIALLCERKH